EANILPGRFDPESAARVAAIVFHLLEASEFQPGRAAGLFGQESAADVGGDEALEMIAELGVEPVFDMAFPDETLPQVHSEPPPADSRIKPMASERRSQFAVSVSSCLRPLAVSL